MKNQLILFGGTFDPVHFGHLIVARAVAERLGMPRVVLIPSARPPHKAQCHASPAHRLAMLRLAVEGDPLFEISTIELDRPGRSYTIDTLRQFDQIRGGDTQLVWTIGLDTLIELGSWHRSEEVVEMARIVTAARPPMPDNLNARLQGLRPAMTAEQIERLKADIFPTPLIDISSTEIRRRVAAGEPIRYLTGDAVIQYIRHQGLYTGGRGS